MKTSKLTFTQQKYLDTIMQADGSLPLSTPKSQIIIEQRQTAKSAEKHEWFHNPPSLRTREKIIAAGLYEQEIYRCIPKKDMFKEKERYQIKLEDQPEEKVIKVVEKEINENDMLVSEIYEREKWMQDMVKLGRGGNYRKQIQSEIDQVNIG
jgi:hypothetical protein